MESKSKTPLEESVERLKHGFRTFDTPWNKDAKIIINELERVQTELQSAKRALAESQAALKLARTRIIESCKKIITESPNDMAVINAIDHALSSDAGSGYALKEELEAEKQHSNELAKDLCRLEDALGANCDIQGGGTDKAMERVRDLIAKEGELGDIQSQLEAAKKEDCEKP